MRLPQDHPKRAVVLGFGWLALGGAGAALLVTRNGPYLGGLLALMWLEALAVPFAVLAFGRRDRSQP